MNTFFDIPTFGGEGGTINLNPADRPIYIPRI